MGRGAGVRGRANPGLGVPGTCAFRDFADVDKMLAAAKVHKRAVVIGGGLLGLEAAWGLKQRGMSVALVHLMPTLMERQLDAAAGPPLQTGPEPPGLALFHHRPSAGSARPQRGE